MGWGCPQRAAPHRRTCDYAMGPRADRATERAAHSRAAHMRTGARQVGRGETKSYRRSGQGQPEWRTRSPGLKCPSWRCTQRRSCTAQGGGGGQMHKLRPYLLHARANTSGQFSHWTTKQSGGHKKDKRPSSKAKITLGYHGAHTEFDPGAQGNSGVDTVAPFTDSDWMLEVPACGQQSERDDGWWS